MSPARAEAVARADLASATRRAERAPETARRTLRSADEPRGRWAGLATSVRSGNVLGRIGTLTAVALFVAVFGVVVFQALLVQGQARLDHLNNQIAQQQAESKQLRLKVAQLDSPERIVNRAAQLGMIDPGDVVYLAPSTDDDARAALTPPTTATPTTAPKSAKAARP